MTQLNSDESTKSLVNSDGTDFETAIAATGFGKFNYLLLCVALIACLSNAFGTTTMSYIIPVAECDLSLSLADKGMLNASGYLGTLCSVFLWGFLADAYGRRKLQIIGQFLDTLCSIGCTFSHSFSMLFIFKYLNGFMGCGPYTILMSYIAEFHSTKYRSKVILLAGVFVALGNAILPLIAWAIFPMNIYINLYFINMNSWRLFLAICTLPAFLAAIGHILLPESPKFLMSNGKNKEAMEIFQYIYHKNTGNDKASYPVNMLIQETQVGQHLRETFLDANITEKKSNRNSFRDGLKQMKRMFFPPYLFNFILVNGLQFVCMMGLNTLRLWLPQFFTTINEYQKSHNYTENASLCDMLSYNKYDNNVQFISHDECFVEQVDDQVYINSVIVSCCGVLGYIFVGPLINAMGKKNLLVISFAIGSVCGIANYWSYSSFVTLAISSLFVTIGNICVQVIIAVTVELFPTSLRTMVTSMTMIFGRIGAMLGNILFPILLEAGCLPPFLMLGSITLVGIILSLLLPKKVPEFS